MSATDRSVGRISGGAPGQVVVVTGASAGVGRAVAQAFGARGARVGLLARGELGLAGAALDVRTAGGQALPVPTDVACHEQVEAAARRVEEAFGPIDVWVNVAFTSVFATAVEIEPEEFKRVMEVNYLGYVYGTKVALARMLPRDRGTIVQVGSALGYRGIPLQSAYCASKHAIQGFHDSLRCELRHRGTRVQATHVLLPAVNTPQFDWVRSRLPKPAQPVPPIYQPEIAARAVLHAADHPRRREYWVGASTVGTMIANAVLPGLLDRYLARTGFASQQVDRPGKPDREGNLVEPLDGVGGHDYGAHGSFDDRSISFSLQLWASRHHGLIGATALGLLAAGAVALRRTGASRNTLRRTGASRNALRRTGASRNTLRRTGADTLNSRPAR